MAFLELQNASVSFSGFLAVDQVSLAVDKGETRVIIGPNGGQFDRDFDKALNLLFAVTGGKHFFIHFGGFGGSRSTEQLGQVADFSGLFGADAEQGVGCDVVIGRQLDDRFQARLAFAAFPAVDRLFFGADGATDFFEGSLPGDTQLF